MDNISMIAAIGKNLELGKNNDLIWRFSEDMKFFREQTMGKPMIMGMNTFKSLPKVLPGREHIILSTRDIYVPEGVLVFHSIEELLKYIEEYKDEVMIIGGASLYKQMLIYARKLILTEIEAEDSKADVFFPNFKELDWDSEQLSIHKEGDITYKHMIYTKKK